MNEVKVSQQSSMAEFVLEIFSACAGLFLFPGPDEQLIKKIDKTDIKVRQSIIYIFFGSTYLPFHKIAESIVNTSGLLFHLQNSLLFCHYFKCRINKFREHNPDCNPDR